jgi:hypothetical protein
MVGHEDHDRLRVWRAEVRVDRGELVLLRASRVEIFQTAHEEDLERGHQRWCLRPVEDLED